MSAYTRVKIRIPLVVSLAVAVILWAPSAVHAELTEEQKDKVRALLPAPEISTSATFSFSVKGGFALKINDRENDDYKKARLAFLLKLPPPDDAEARLRYFRSVGDLQSVLEDAAAKKTYDTGEKLALSLAREGTPRARARFLALAAGFHADQEEYKEADVPLKEALRLAPDTWEARYVESQILWQSVESISESKTLEHEAVQRWIDAKPSLETEKKVLGFADGAVAAINKAVALQEKVSPDPKNRSPNPYIKRILYRIQAGSLRETLAGQRSGQSVSYSNRFSHHISDENTIRDIENATSCEPDNPYAILARHIARYMKARNDAATAKESKMALAELARIEKKPSVSREDRLRLLEVQAIFLVMTDDWDAATAKAKQGLALSPSRELFRVVYPAGWIKQEKFAEVEQFVSNQLEKYDTTWNRLALARAQFLQNDFTGAERTLVPLVETDKSTATPSIFLAAVRLKATSSNTTETEWLELRDFIQEINTNYAGKTDRDEALNYYLVIATLYALNDKEDDAKVMLKRVLDADEDNEAAKEMIALLP